MSASAPTSTHDALLDAAARVFGRAGYRDATVQAIAEEAGFTPPTVYAHFGSKQGLFEALVKGLMESLWSTVGRQLPDGLSLAQFLELRVGALLELAARHRDIFSLLILRPHDVPILDAHAEEDRRLEAHWRTELARFEGELGDRTVEEAALLVDGVLYAFVKQWIRSGEPTLAPKTRRIVALILGGLEG